MKFIIKASNIVAKISFNIRKFKMQKLFIVFLLKAISFANGYPFEANSVFLDDMELSNEQYNLLFVRTGLPLGFIDKLWTKNDSGVVEIPYYVNKFSLLSNYSDNELLGIREAMDDMESKTCIRFIERTDQIDYIDIQSGHGCWSKVGKRGGRQFVTLMSLTNNYSCMDKASIQHELMHTLGFYHMHMHQDRDEFVEVIRDNIDARYRFSFLKVQYMDNYGTPYDLDSILHYERNYYAKNYYLDTIVPHDRSFLNTIGRALEMSEGDVKRINNMYQCNTF